MVQVAKIVVQHALEKIVIDSSVKEREREQVVNLIRWPVQSPGGKVGRRPDMGHLSLSNGPLLARENKNVLSIKQRRRARDCAPRVYSPA